MAEGSRSSADIPAWARVALPSVADIIFVAFLAALVFTPLSVRLLGDAGIGWHIRTGQQILATHAIPRVDSFSSTMGGRPWFAWEWLYDLVVGRLEATCGLNGVVWFTAVVIAAVFAWMFRLLVLRGTSALVALALVLLTASASMIHLLARPHVLSWLFTLAWFWILESSERRSFGEGKTARRLWALPLLMAVWVNVHGGFVVGFALLAIFWLAALWEWLGMDQARIEDVLGRIAARQRVQTLTGVGVASAAASLVNPYGWKLHVHVYSYLSDTFLMNHIEEFRSADFHGLAPGCFLILVLITLATLTAGRGKLRVSNILTVLFAVGAGLYSSRSIPVSSLLLAMVVGPILPALAVPREFFQRMGAVEAGLRGHAWPILTVAVTIWIACHGGQVGSIRLMDARFDAGRMPVEAVNHLEKHPMKGPVLSVDYWGGYLIYRLAPQNKVVVDDRHDLYGADFFRSYLRMWRGEPGGVDGFFMGREIGYVLLPREAALSTILIESRRWKTVYADNTAVVFVRDGVGANQ